MTAFQPETVHCVLELKESLFQPSWIIYLLVIHDKLSYLLHEGQKRLSVVLPFLRQFALVGELVTAEEDRNLKAVGVQIAKVIHA